MITATAAALLALRLASVQLNAGPTVKSVPFPPAAAKSAPQNPEQTRCDLVATDADLQTMLRTLSMRSKIGLVLLSPSDLKITTNLIGIPFIDALKHLCALSGLSYLKVGPTYIVATKDRLREAYPDNYFSVHPDEKPKPVQPVVAPPAPEVVTEVYLANYVSSTQLSDALGQIFGKDKLTVVAGPIQENPSVTSQNTTSSTGVQSNVLTRDGNSTPAVGKMLVLRGEKATVQEALALAKQMDSMRPQVGIQVTIYDISDEALSDLGVSWSYGDISLKETGGKGVNFGSFARAPMTFNGVIKALEQNDKAKLLASPNVSVLDGERAFILIGDRVNYPVLVGYSQNNAPIFSKEEERVGIYMQVAASVSSDDNVTLSLYPQVSNITGFLNVNGASYPQIATREAQTTLRVKTGETVVLGGLLKTEETGNYDQVPILSQIPFLGELFKHRKVTKSASQVIISITPTVIRSNESR